MNKLKNLFISIIIGLAVAVIAVAFTGPSSQPPIGNPDFWIKSGNDVYYNPAVSGNVGIGTASPGAYKLNVQGGQINTSGGLCIAGDCKTAWSQVASTNYWTLSGADLYPNQTSYNVGIGVVNPWAKLQVETSEASGTGMFVSAGNASGNNYGIDVEVYGSGAVSNTAGYFYANGGTNNIGIQISGIPTGTNNYSLYSNSSAKSYFTGSVGIGTTLPGQKLTVVGTIESTSGGIKFPDGTIQTTAGGGGGLGGGGTVNYVGKFTGTGTVGNSQIFDNGTNVGIGTASPAWKFDVRNGQINASGGLCINTDCKTSWSQAYPPGLSGWNGKPVDTVSQALTDGFVIVITHHYAGGITQILSDSTNPPTTVRAKSSTGSGTTEFGTTLTVPIRKNDYWKVTNTADPATIYWVALGG